MAATSPNGSSGSAASRCRARSSAMKALLDTLTATLLPASIGFGGSGRPPSKRTW